jgi:hypothetical protein
MEQKNVDIWIPDPYIVEMINNLALKIPLVYVFHKFFKINWILFYFFILNYFLMFLNYFKMLMSKIIFFKKTYFDIFLNIKYFKK